MRATFNYILWHMKASPELNLCSKKRICCSTKTTILAVHLNWLGNCFFTRSTFRYKHFFPWKHHFSSTIYPRVTHMNTVTAIWREFAIKIPAITRTMRLSHLHLFKRQQSFVFEWSFDHLNMTVMFGHVVRASLVTLRSHYTTIYDVTWPAIRIT